LSFNERIKEEESEAGRGGVSQRWRWTDFAIESHNDGVMTNPNFIPNPPSTPAFGLGGPHIDQWALPRCQDHA
jgi:hypothetical protein